MTGDPCARHRTYPPRDFSHVFVLLYKREMKDGLMVSDSISQILEPFYRRGNTSPPGSFGSIREGFVRAFAPHLIVHLIVKNVCPESQGQTRDHVRNSDHTSFIKIAYRLLNFLCLRIREQNRFLVLLPLRTVVSA